MKIKTLQYQNQVTGWKLEPIDFSDLTLLVGVSGVGKTQTLKAILDLKNIANGISLSGLLWNITFSTDNEYTYSWQGEFEIKGFDIYELLDEKYKSQLENRPKIIREKLFLNEQLIVDRTPDTILFNGNKTPKLSPVESILQLLNQEDEIAPAHRGFNKIIQSNDDAERLTSIFSTQFNDLINKHPSLQDIQESTLNTHLKLALAYFNVPDVFNHIKSYFIEVFPHVTDLKLETVRQDGLHVLWAEYPLLQIQEEGVNHWIYEQRISAGMRKVLMQISEIYLSPPGTVILIDEFENSLGVNCIDILPELLAANRNLQFIITSHHPYIINNIGLEHWKILTRNGSVVTAKNAQDFDLGKSRHDAFIQLINLEAYSEGIKV